MSIDRNILDQVSEWLGEPVDNFKNKKGYYFIHPFDNAIKKACQRPRNTFDPPFQFAAKALQVAMRCPEEIIFWQ